MAPTSTAPSPTIPQTTSAPAGPTLGDTAIDIYTKANDYPLLAALCIAHFFNDFCMGVAAPMIPTMESRFSMTLGAVAGIVVVVGLMANFVQPLAGWIMERTRTGAVLMATCMLTGLVFLVGLAETPAQARMLFFIAGAANGVFHPFSYLLAQLTLPRQPAFSTAVFISFGFMGVSTGSMVSGHWMEARGFDNFHYLYLAAFIPTLAMISRSVHRIELGPYLKFIRPKRTLKAGEIEKRAPHFALVFVLTFLLALEVGTIMFFTPKLFKLIYGSEAQGGNATFLLGIAGGIFSYIYGHQADKRNAFGVVLIAQILAVPALLGYFFLDSILAKMIAIACVGMTLGGALPVMQSMGRESRGLTVGMRTALILGGVWGLTALMNYAMAHVVDLGWELHEVMRLVCFVPFAAIPLLVYTLRRA